MSHEHQIIDTDIQFVIDPYTKTIRDLNPSSKKIAQYDHNSERCTFYLDRFIEGHDMSLCTQIEVHFTNTNKKTKEENTSYCPIGDVHVNPDKEDQVVFSWLISRASTQYIGPLKFYLHFACEEDDGSISYEWNTLPYNRLSISDGLDNREAIDLIRQQVDDTIDRLGLEPVPQTYILVDDEGNEIPAVLVDEKVELTATANDIRVGTTAVTKLGVTEGDKEIPAYHTTEGYKLIPSGSPFEISGIHEYDYTKLLAMICTWNTEMSDSVAVEKTVINRWVYSVNSTEALSEVSIDDENMSINLGIINEATAPCVVRYITYKEVL